VSDLIPIERIYQKIYLIRGEKVMLDSDLAELYEVETKALKRQVKRNGERFPDDFMFQLNKEEYESLRRQIGTLKRGEHAKYLPYAFTEQGVAMLSSVLNSKKAILVNVQIIRAFTKMRTFLLNNDELRRKVQELDKKVTLAFEALDNLMAVRRRPTRKIGFLPQEK
jgi:phage regulator Rha-like protein